MAPFVTWDTCRPEFRRLNSFLVILARSVLLCCSGASDPLVRSPVDRERDKSVSLSRPLALSSGSGMSLPIRHRSIILIAAAVSEMLQLDNELRTYRDRKFAYGVSDAYTL